MTARWRLAASGLLALLCPLPLPHLDSYLALALGLWAGMLAVKESGPTYLLLMGGVLVVYVLVMYGLLTLGGWTIRRARRPSATD